MYGVCSICNKVAPLQYVKLDEYRQAYFDKKGLFVCDNCIQQYMTTTRDSKNFETCKYEEE